MEWPIQAFFLCFFRYSTHSIFSSWAASSCGVLIIIMLTPLVYSSSQSFPSVFHFMRSVRSVRLTCVYCFPLDMEKIIEILCDLLFCSKASLFTKWPTLSQMSQCWDSRRVSSCFVSLSEFDPNLIAVMMIAISCSVPELLARGEFGWTLCLLLVEFGLFNGLSVWFYLFF